MASIDFGGVKETVVTRKEFSMSKARKVLKKEIIAVGQALARLDPDRAWTTFEHTIRPSKFFDRLFAGGATQKVHRQFAGVAALGLVPRDEAEDAIRWLSKRAGEELHQHCMKTLVLRRRGGVTHG